LQQNSYNDKKQQKFFFFTFLSKKKKKKRHRRDFRPGEHVIVESATAACVALCELLNNQRLAVVGCLDGGNARVFLRALGGRFFEALLAHLKRFPVSLGLGGTQLLMDLSRYGDTARAFADPHLDAQLSALRHLANIHLVDRSSIPALLKELTTTTAADAIVKDAEAEGLAGTQHVGLTVTDIKEYLHTHELYNSSWLDYCK
jgi:hypothetical protein